MPCSSTVGHCRRLWRFLAAAALVAGLSGCFVPQARIHEANAKAAADYARCDALRRAGKLASREAAVQCAASYVMAAYKEAAYPFMDLVYIDLEARRIGAARVDHQELTAAQYHHDLAALHARIAAEDRRRRAIIDYGGDPKPVPVATLIAGLKSFAPTVTARTPANPNCVPLGQIRPCQ